jgi:UDP-3-O-[3-hydroxymyristoyl] glucosamine N-acyltransferase
VGVGDKVGSGVGVGVGVGVAVAVEVGSGVGVGVGVAMAVAVEVGSGVGVGVELAMAVAVEVGSGVGVGVGTGFADRLQLSVRKPIRRSEDARKQPLRFRSMVKKSVQNTIYASSGDREMLRSDYFSFPAIQSSSVGVESTVTLKRCD